MLFQKYLLQHHGEEKLNRVIARLPVDAQDIIKNPNPNQWYPVELIKEFYDAVGGELEKDDSDILYRMGRFVADESAKGFLRYLTRLISVPTLINRMSAFWKHYHKGGGISAEITRSDPERKYGIVTVFGYPAGPSGRKAMQGYIEATLQRAGAKDLRIDKNAEQDNDADTYSWKLSWK